MASLRGILTYCVPNWWQLIKLIKWKFTISKRSVQSPPGDYSYPNSRYFSDSCDSDVWKFVKNMGFLDISLALQCIVFLPMSAVLYFIAVAVNFLYGRLALQMVLAVKLVLKLNLLKHADFSCTEFSFEMYKWFINPLLQSVNKPDPKLFQSLRVEQNLVCLKNNWVAFEMMQEHFNITAE